MFRPRPLFLAVPVTLTLVGTLLAGCGSDESDLRATGDATRAPAADGSSPEPAATAGPAPTAAPAASSEPVVVEALDNSFRAAELTVEVGTKVRWENVGRNDHDVLPVDGADWGVVADDFAPGDEYSHVFETAGTYEYVCTIHGVPGAGMIGTIIVTDDNS
jgi:plastocyanin